MFFLSESRIIAEDADFKEIFCQISTLRALRELHGGKTTVLYFHLGIKRSFIFAWVLIAQIGDLRYGGFDEKVRYFV